MGQAYDYYGTLAGVLCIGPNEDLISIILNGQEVWPQGTPWAVGITCTAGQLYVFDAQTWTCTTTHVATSANAPGSGLEGWTEYTFERSTEDYDDFSLTGSDGTYYGVMRLYWGTTTQTVDPLLESGANDGGVQGNYGNGDQHPDYQGVAYVVLNDFLLGEEVTSGPNVEIVVRRKPNQTIITDSAAGITDGQANLAAVAVELLTDENCVGESTDIIDVPSFQAAADYLQTNQALYGASVLIDSQDSISSLFDKLVQMFDGYVRFNPTSQKIEMGIYQHGVTPATYTTLTADSFTKMPKFTTKSWQETLSRATVRYNDRQLNYQQTSTQVDDPRAFFVLGTVRAQNLDRPWIARLAQAIAHGQETLRVIGHAQMTGELVVRREIGRTIRAGDYVLVDVDIEPNTYSIYQFFRVTQRKIPPTGPITLQVFADNTLAPVPWTNPSAPVTVTEPVVPPITSFRFLEVPTILSGEAGEITCLAQRPSNLIVGAYLYFDTSATGTFSTLLGTVPNFAAKATLHAAVAATDTIIQLTVDTTQVDANYFTQSYSTEQAADDTMLMFIVSVVASGTDAGEVAENDGYQVMEICSVSTQTLISAGQYNLAVLRGRKNTTATAFTTANTEVWLIPSNLLAFFNNQLFDTIRANRLAALTPAYAQFRLCPFTYVNSLPLADATSEQFRFPEDSSTSPSLSLTAPNTFALTESGVTFPLSINVAGTWTAPDGNLVEITTKLRLSTETTDRLVFDQTFAPSASQTFNNFVQIDGPGSFTIKLFARTATNLVIERDIEVVVTGGAPQCALVDVFDANGNQILNANGTPPTEQAGKWQSAPNEFIPFGPLTLRCSTPGATITFGTGGLVLTAGALQVAGGGTYIQGNFQPFNGLVNREGGSGLYTQLNSYVLEVQATAPGYAASAILQITIPLFYTSSS